MTSIVRVTGEQVLPARDLEEYWLYWAEFPGKRAAAMLLPCCVLRHDRVRIGFGESWARALVTISLKSGVKIYWITWLN